MHISIYSNKSLDKDLSLFDTFDTMILSTQNLRYKNMSDAKVYQISSADIFNTALDDFHASVYVLDLFDELAKQVPKALGTFLDAYEDGDYDSTRLVIVVENRALIEEWELFDVTYL